jgi:hypothetical protein
MEHPPRPGTGIGEVGFLEVVDLLFYTVVKNVKISCGQAFGRRGHALQSLCDRARDTV